ncbi:tRNA (adenosine(37)-N6)-threonylcarbamoyltransferase complex dimerization subunit type 1 TsaB [Advenella sp. RU8]|uniref:tRNA (adenosine(37)-N6)-threonylcarbamoyltransferase complex dimerization subunit type 1 TsaB n=1 Tax=Advenella sp. RU8 TaxID=3399575 RepID=UPI003AB0094F
MTNINLIGIETSGSGSSVALLRANEQGHSTVTVRHNEVGQQHAERLLPMLDELLEEAGLAKTDIHGIAFGQGPGGFTGLRIACGAAQGLGFGLGVPVYPVTSLRATAELAREQAAGHYIVSVLDARMSEVFMAVYRQDSNHPGGLETVQGPCLIAADQVFSWLESQRAEWELKAGENIRFLLAGNALLAYPEVLQEQAGIAYGPSVWAGADTVVQLALSAWHKGEFIQPDHASPLYVRDKVAFTTQEREQGAGGNPKAGLPVGNGRPVPENEDVLPPENADYLVQAMQEAHVDEVLAIEQAVQEKPWTKGNFLDALKANYPGWVITDRQNTVLGFALQMLAPDVSHLLLIGVMPGCQGQGLGSRLLAVTENKLKEAGLDLQVLEVRPSNQQARVFYERHHYVQIGVRKGYYSGNNGESEDALVLQKSVA